jgi:hypothetical protein
MFDDPLLKLLRPKRLTAVVDIGANPIDGDPPYKDLLQKRGCRVTGFEPQPEALAILNKGKSELETYLPNVIGDGNPATLRICRRLNRGQLATLNVDLQKIEAIFGVIDSGRRCLAHAVAIQAEVSFLPLYEGQPTFAEIDQALRKLGFIPHTFAAINRRMIAPLFDERNPYAALNQLLEADAVYVRNFTRPEAMTDEQLKHLAIIAHHCYRSFDLVTNCIFHLCRRQVIAADSVQNYMALFRSMSA